MLRKICEDKPREWHRYLIPTVFAFREIPSDRPGFSAFDLLYGRSVRGLLTVLRELWEDHNIEDRERDTFQLIIELRDKLDECAKIAARNADVYTTRYMAYFDARSQDRQVKPGDEVLVLLSSGKKGLLLSWNGPYKVMERRNNVDDVIAKPKGPKLLHVNLLKRYYRRAQVGLASVLNEFSPLADLDE